MVTTYITLSQKVISLLLLEGRNRAGVHYYIKAKLLASVLLIKNLSFHISSTNQREMTLSGALAKEASINSDGDAFFEIFSRKPYLTADMSPLNIRRVDLIDGDWGSVGSIIMWNYFYGTSTTLRTFVDDLITFSF